MYFACVMIMCTISVTTTVVVLNFHHRSPEMYEMPGWVRRSRLILAYAQSDKDGSVAEWLACWTQAQKGPGSNRSRDAVG